MLGRKSAERQKESLIPVNIAAFCIDLFAGKDGVPYPDTILGEQPEWMTQSEIDAETASIPTPEELLQDPGIRALVEATKNIPSYCD
jgi:hypothetical protein